MATPNLGSGSALLQGGNQALIDAIQRRQTGQGNTTPQTPGSAGFNPATQSPQLPNPQASPASLIPSTPSATMQQAPSAQMMPPGATPPQNPGALMGFQTAPENQMILQALNDKLKSNASIEKMNAKGAIGGGI